MEALSGVASGMAVASLSIQLIESIGTIKTFIGDVKGASKELERLSELLDQLGALLGDVKDVMERQTSLQGHHFPAPSVTIFNCLKNCESSLQLLNGTVEKYKGAQSGNTSAIVRLKSDIEFGFKMKDIAGFEVRIERDINYLQTALATNSTSILTSVLPVILQACQLSVSPPPLLNQPPVLPEANILQVSRGDQKPNPPKSVVGQKTFRHRSWISSQLEWFGVYQRKSIRYIRLDGSTTYDDNNIISESNDMIVAWWFAKFGLQWNRQYPNGRIPSSFSTYPVVSGWNIDVFAKFCQGSVQDIQKMFCSGNIHPFTRTIDGESLLHLWSKGGMFAAFSFSMV
ncbi:hypothetical protein GQ44DRAFT_177105 [Phaeosphaeriaceae sp. PMI808]|nr:hypothetical protein GQ44DRAFT_177105 [Phaeosphaeriaceae sp. PMI808]